MVWEVWVLDYPTSAITALNRREVESTLGEREANMSAGLMEMPSANRWHSQTFSSPNARNINSAETDDQALETIMLWVYEPGRYKVPSKALSQTPQSHPHRKQNLESRKSREHQC